MVSGQAAADVVHLLAELLENATLFSPRNTQVQVVAADAPGGGVLIEIRDEGVGVSTGRLAEMNWRLDHPPGVDVSVSRHMGLFAVSRLAARRGIRVRLRAGAPQGLTALVWLPGTLTSHEQPQAVGTHSRPHTNDVALAEEMAFADATRAETDPQRVGGRHGGRHRLGLLASSASPDEAAPVGRGYAASADNGYGSADNGYARAENANANANANDGYAAGNGRAGGNGQAAAGGQPEQRSVWFAAKSPSAPAVARDAEAPGGDVRSAPSNGNGGQGDDWGASARLTAGAHYSGAFPAAARAAAGDGQAGPGSPLPQTSAGLPKRVPQGTPGLAGQPAGYGAATEEVPVLGAPPGGGLTFPATGAQRQAAPQAPRRRSAEGARNRVSGFQLGSRDAAQAGNASWAAFPRADEPPS
jgi:hypothetical protein